MSRRQWDTGSQRDQRDGKGRYDLLPPEAIRAWASRLEFGASKYGDRNWEKGQPLSTYLDSGIRHAFQVLSGDRTEDHAGAVLFNFGAFIATASRIKAGTLPAELDDIGWCNDGQG